MIHNNYLLLLKNYIRFELLCAGNFKVIHRRDECTPGNIAHMGMVILQNKCIDVLPTEMDCKTLKFSTKKMQFSKLNIFKKISVLFVYINKTPGILETHEIGTTLKKEKATVIIGDFNLNTDEEEGKKKVQDLCKILEMQQVNKESTRNKSTLDLIFRIDMKELDFMPFVFQNMYSDHSAVGFRYCEDGVISKEYAEFQIRKQNIDFLQKTTIDEMAKQDSDRMAKHEKTTPKAKRNPHKKINAPNSSYAEGESDVEIMSCPIDVVRISNLRKLLAGEWVDSNVINCYFYLISEEFSQVFTTSTWFNEQLKSTAFQTVEREFKSKNLFEYQLWMVPINCKNRHWFLLIIDTSSLIENKVEMKIYDSLGESQTWKKVLEERNIKMYIHWKFQQTYQLEESGLEIEIYDMHHQIPQQFNGIDCGIFTMMYAKYLAAGHEITFNHQDMGMFRRKIYDEISRKKLEHIIWDNEEEFEVPENFSDYEKDNMEEIKMPGKFTEKAGNEEAGSQTHENIYSNKNLNIYRFVNPGGTNQCFSNAVANVILNVQGIQELFGEDLHIININPVFKELKRLKNLPNNQPLSTKNLRRIVQEQCLKNKQNGRNFDNNNQFDAAEFLGSLLEHMLHDHSDIELFGQVQETIFCMNDECNAADAVPPNEVNIVVLPLVGPTLLMCLNDYLTVHEIERNCPNCGNPTASQVTSFNVEPETIIFQISRFRYSADHNSTIKVHDEIDIPTRINLPSGALYNIVGTINHYGQSANSGHYTAAIYNQKNKRFYLCDDETISEVGSLEVDDLPRKVYLVIYQRQ